MKKTVTWLALAIFLAGCAVGTGQQPSGRAFTGEVWVWDKATNTVTLRQGTEFVRVQVTPDQVVGLQPHQIATVRGDLAPPAEIPVVIVPTPPMAAVPSGPVDQTEVTGTVAALDPNGRISVNSSRGRLDAWVAAGAGERFPAGSPVRLRMTVQRLAMVPASGAPAPGSASPASEPAAMAGEPGDYSTITGRILRVDPMGVIAVESPRGPLDVLVPDSSRYQVGESVQVRTSLHRAE